MRMYNPPHPGGIFEDVLPAIPMTVSQFARHIGVARGTLSRIINGRAGITAEMSIRLSQALGQGQDDIWFLMQNDYDFWQAEHSRKRKKMPRVVETAIDIAA